LLSLQVQIRQYRGLDGTGLREDFVLVQKEVIAGGEIFNGDSHHAVEVLINQLNFALKFLPENFLLSGRWRRRLGKARRNE
jgi:hypothetical protein